jgi:hypothetical protein
MKKTWWNNSDIICGRRSVISRCQAQTRKVRFHLEPGRVILLKDPPWWCTLPQQTLPPTDSTDLKIVPPTEHTSLLGTSLNSPVIACSFMRGRTVSLLWWIVMETYGNDASLECGGLDLNPYSCLSSLWEFDIISCVHLTFHLWSKERERQESLNLRDSRMSICSAVRRKE